MTPPLTIHREDTILTITFHRESTDAEHIAHLEELHAIMEQAKPTQIYRWVVINDIRTTIFSSPGHRQRQAKWMIEHSDEIRHRTAGIGFVCTSTLVRGGLTAVFWLAPLPTQHGIFASLEEAQRWALERNRIYLSELAPPVARVAVR